MRWKTVLWSLWKREKGQSAICLSGSLDLYRALEFMWVRFPWCERKTKIFQCRCTRDCIMMLSFRWYVIGNVWLVIENSMKQKPILKVCDVHLTTFLEKQVKRCWKAVYHSGNKRWVSCSQNDLKVPSECYLELTDVSRKPIFDACFTMPALDTPTNCYKTSKNIAAKL